MNVPISTTTEITDMRMPKMSLTTPNMTSPTMPRVMYPNQATKVMRVEPTAESNLHQVCVMLMFVAILPWFKFICGSGNWREVLVSSPFCRSLFRHFFCVFLSHRSFRFRCLSRAARLEIQGFSDKILPNGVEIFSKTEGSTFYFQSPLPYLCTCTITIDAKGKTMWRKENQSGNEMRNFTEVLGLHDYRILISWKWIYRLAFISREW